MKTVLLNTKSEKTFVLRANSFGKLDLWLNIRHDGYYGDGSREDEKRDVCNEGKARLYLSLGAIRSNETFTRPIFENVLMLAARTASPFDSVNVESAAGFLLCQPGDVDSDYFKDYTDTQMAFSRRYAQYFESDRVITWKHYTKHLRAARKLAAVPMAERLAAVEKLLKTKPDGSDFEYDKSITLSDWMAGQPYQYRPDWYVASRYDSLKNWPAGFDLKI